MDGHWSLTSRLKVGEEKCLERWGKQTRKEWLIKFRIEKYKRKSK